MLLPLETGEQQAETDLGASMIGVGQFPGGNRILTTIHKYLSSMDWLSAPDGGSHMRSKVIIVCASALAALSLTGCAIQRAEEASQAQKSMVGMDKEHVLACMGAPAASAQVGETEVWTYNSGNGNTLSLAGALFGGDSSVFRPPQPVIGGFAGGQPVIGGFVNGQPVIGGFVSPPPVLPRSSDPEILETRSCKVDVVMHDDRVAQVNYGGLTGGLLTKGEQCAFAIDNCARQLAAADPPAKTEKLSRRMSFGAVFDDAPGLRVFEVRAGGVADRAGIKGGDDILAFDGKALSTPQELQTLISLCRSGDKKKIQIVRDGRRIVVEANF